MLLIDEAYALARGGEDDFGREAIDTIVKLIEDHRDDVVVIVAGYPDEMEEFIDANPACARASRRRSTSPTTPTTSCAIFESHVLTKAAYRLRRGARRGVQACFDRQPEGKGFGNGRLARNLFEAAVARQATALVASRGPDRRAAPHADGGRHPR